MNTIETNFIFSLMAVTFFGFAHMTAHVFLSQILCFLGALSVVAAFLAAFWQVLPFSKIGTRN